MLDFVLGECFSSFNHCSTLRGFFTSATGASPIVAKCALSKWIRRTSWLNTVLALLRACIALPMLRTIDWKTAPSAGIATLSTPARHDLPLASASTSPANITLCFWRNAHLVRFVKAPNPHIRASRVFLRTIVPTSCCVRFKKLSSSKRAGMTILTVHDNACTKPAQKFESASAYEARFLSGVRGGLLPAPSANPSRG